MMPKVRIVAWLVFNLARFSNPLVPWRSKKHPFGWTKNLSGIWTFFETRLPSATWLWYSPFGAAQPTFSELNFWQIATKQWGCKTSLLWWWWFACSCYGCITVMVPTRLVRQANYGCCRARSVKCRPARRTIKFLLSSLRPDVLVIRVVRVIVAQSPNQWVITDSRGIVQSPSESEYLNLVD